MINVFNFFRNMVFQNLCLYHRSTTPAATLYRDRIDAAANGRPLPTELPSSNTSMSNAGSTHSSNGSLSSG